MDYKKIKQEIREVERQWKTVFSIEEPFNKHMNRWRDEILYDMYDHNQFVPVDEITEEDLVQALSYQKEHHWDFLKIDARTPLDSKLMMEHQLEESKTETMVFVNGDTTDWKTNNAVQVQDVKDTDIENDLVEIEVTNYGSSYGDDFANRKIRRYIEKAKEVPEFHYYGAYVNGKIEGACYAYAKDGYVQVDGLIVNPKSRKQYIATTLIKYIAMQHRQMVFLHADADDTPKEMYQKLGFEVVDVLYEYSK